MPDTDILLGVSLDHRSPYPQESSDLIGCLRDKIEVDGDLLSTGIAWNADAQP